MPGLQCLVGKCHSPNALRRGARKKNYSWAPGPDSTPSLPGGNWVSQGCGCHRKGVSGAEVLVLPSHTCLSILGLRTGDGPGRPPQRCRLHIATAQCIVFLAYAVPFGPGGITHPCNTSLLLAGSSNFFTRSHESVDSTRIAVCSWPMDPHLTVKVEPHCVLGAGDGVMGPSLPFGSFLSGNGGKSNYD